MTNSQCIEVAENLWGWELVDYLWFNSDGQEMCGKFVLGYEVNSWQGFGRTVEAMADKKWVLSDSSMTGLVFFSHLGKEVEIKINDDWENQNRPTNGTNKERRCALVPSKSI